MIAVALAATLQATAPADHEVVDRERTDVHRGARMWNGWAGAMTLVGTGLHIAGVVSMQTSGHRTPGLSLMTWGTIVNAHALVATGLGSWYRGRAYAADGTPPPAWKNPRLGWPLFATGLAVFVASRVAPMGCFTTECASLTSEIGYFGGMTAMIVGLHAAGVGHGHRQSRRTRITPTAHISPRETFTGLALSGHF